MRAKTSLILVTCVVLGAALATRRFLSLLGVISGRPLWGYGASPKRPSFAAENLRRSTAEEQSETARELLGRLVKRIKAKYDQYAADGRKEPPGVDILIISGGGDWG